MFNALALKPNFQNLIFNIHRLQLGLLGSRIPFAPQAFVYQRQ